FIIWFVYLIIGLFTFQDNVNAGAFGDSFGILNTLFSGLALGGVIFTVYQQKKELELQRQELKATREEMQKSTIAQQNSERALSDQVKSMELTAKISGLNTMLRVETALMEKLDMGNPGFADAFLKARKIRSLIANLLNDQDLNNIINPKKGSES
ncbi:MAG TPA: hypothetical protein P5184_08955, partial [Bacteroidales bacterium]|nr:hypothetical protein [Bacteroidales bacterium]